LSVSRYRIPRLTVAALILGACGDDDGGDSSAGINVSDSRIQSTARAACRYYAECEPDAFAEYYESPADCVATYQDDFAMYVETYGKECTDAYLDWMDCAVVLGCDADVDTKCASAEKKIDQLCVDGEPGEGASNLVRLPGLRIPR